MQTFIDAATQLQWAFDDDVVVKRDGAGAYLFAMADGRLLSAPATLLPHVPVAPSVEQQLAEAQATQAAMMSAACRATLLGGFPSSALGAEHDYPSQDIDQSNLQAAVLASIGADADWETPIWSARDGVWSLAPHTSAQVRQVNLDWVAFRVAAQQKYAGLLAEINSATSVSAVQAITWG